MHPVMILSSITIKKHVCDWNFAVSTLNSTFRVCKCGSFFCMLKVQQVIRQLLQCFTQDG